MRSKWTNFSLKIVPCPLSLSSKAGLPKWWLHVEDWPGLRGSELGRRIHPTPRFPSLVLVSAYHANAKPSISLALPRTTTRTQGFSHPRDGLWPCGSKSETKSKASSKSGGRSVISVIDPSSNLLLRTALTRKLSKHDVFPEAVVKPEVPRSCVGGGYLGRGRLDVLVRKRVGEGDGEAEGEFVRVCGSPG